MNYAKEFSDFVKREKLEYLHALFFKGRATTYGELIDESDKVASALFNECGVKKGDAVGIYMSNSPQVVATFFGITRLGAIVVPINTLLTRYEIKPFLEETKASTIFISPTYLPTMEQMKPELPNLKNVIVVSEEAVPGTISYYELLKKAKSPPPEVELEDDAVAVTFFTSGTTGKPKGTMLTSKGLMNVVEGHHEFYSKHLGGMVAVLAALPLTHIWGLNTITISCLFRKSPVVIEDAFVPEETAKDIETYRVSMLWGVPYHATRLLELVDKYDMSSLKLVLLAGQVVPPELWERIEKTFNCYGAETYGLTEGTGQTIGTPLGQRRPLSTGIPYPGTEIKIVDDNDNELPVGEVGEVVHKSVANMKGYLNMPEATAQTLKDGWLHTGDLGKVDKDGYLYIAGRKKELIKRGGYNVYPLEIESTIFEHPKVSEVAVFGVNDARKGETVGAAVVPKAGEKVTEEELINYCQERLARYKVPKYIKIMESPLPKTPSGKILKRHLQEEMNKEITG